MIDLAQISAIDVHVRAEVSCHDPEDPVMGKFFDAASAYFKADRQRPTIAETIHFRSSWDTRDRGRLLSAGRGLPVSRRAIT
ncbi:MAG: hypothetical protein SGJ23_08530 [Alphaproteobacteria bacterium]|nr:hypothetical protein [Alphaproteobacteria bacterium]